MAGRHPGAGPWAPRLRSGSPGCLGLANATAVLVRKGRELEVIGNGTVVLPNGHACTSNTSYELEFGEAAKPLRG